MKGAWEELLALRKRWIESRYFLIENHLGEIRVSWIRLVGLVVFYGNECFNYYALKAVEPWFHERVAIVSWTWFIAAVALWYLTARRHWYKPIVAYVSTTVDVACLASILYIGGRDLSQVFVAFFPLIALGGIRYSFGMTLYGGLLSAAAYTFVAVQNDVAAVGHVMVLELVIRVLGMMVLAFVIGSVVINSSQLMIRIVDEEVRAERIKDTLARYVSTQVAEEILKNRDGMKMEGERRLVTILMSDLRGFTALAERIPAEEVVRQLNGYFEIMIDVIFKYRGTLDKFIGDAILAVYGAPVPDEDHAERAVRTALEMQAAMHAYNADRVARGEEPLHMGIGINSGEVVAGNIGSEKRLEYTVIGDPVNLAQRIESRSGRGEILIAAETFERVKDLVEVEALPEMVVKNRVQPIRVYRLTGLR